MEYAFSNQAAGASQFSDQSTGTEYVLHRVGVPDTPASWEPFGEPLVQVNGKPIDGLVFDGSDDLCHLILGATDPLLPVTEHTVGQMYDYSRGCGGSEHYVRALAVTNAGPVINPECKVDLGTEYGALSTEGQGKQESSFNTVNVDGSIIFVTTAVKGKPNCTGHQVFARLGGERTLEVSKPLAEACADVPCPGASSRAAAYFTGASEDGSKVFFTTAAPLVAGDKDTGNDLYMATIGCGEGEAGCAAAERRVTSLVQVSHDPVVGQAADVQGVLRIAPDGSRVYFVAHGVLSEGPNAEGREPVSGGDNLYLYDAETGRTTFVTDLCSGPELSGAARDAACPAGLTGGEGFKFRNDSGLWSNGQEVSSTRDGRVLVFSSYGRLTPDDADSAKDVYRFDSTTGSLLRVSAGENGYDANGNDEFDATISPAGIQPSDSVRLKRELSFRSISDDGSRIIFYSSGPLSPRAQKRVPDIYEWHASPEGGPGVVSMVSGGASDSPDFAATISPSGRDIFFLTAQGLVPGDQDGLVDVYDARLGGGGFPQAETARQSCSSDACQGPLSNPAPLLMPGSAVQRAGDNLQGQSPPAPATKKSVKKRPGCKKAKARGRKARCARRAARRRTKR
ncbi:MAG TPA: hypothetical protein VNY27_12585 [Solirubrobacteraceae bacterium]|nr:hypothetical protein [Solirubrobacteraceae bacterium]